VPVEVIRLLVDEWKDGLKEKDGWGGIPLHSGLYFNSSLEVIRLIVEAFVDGGKVKNKDGNIPLHVGLSSNAPVEVIRLVVKVGCLCFASIGGVNASRVPN
jgi:hypothetical protein